MSTDPAPNPQASPEPTRRYADRLLGTSLPNQITVLSALIAQPYYARLQKRYGLLLVQWRVLRAIAARPGTTQSEIATDWGLNLMTVNRVTFELRKRSLIVGETDENDRRRVRFWLTEDGAAVFEPIAEEAAAWGDMLVANLSQAEIDEFERLVQKMTEFVRTEPHRAITDRDSDDAPD